MSDQDLRALADSAGIALSYRDVFGQPQPIGVAALRHVLAALGLPADTDAAIADSHARLASPGTIPPLLTGDAGVALHLPHRPGRFSLQLEDGSRQDGTATPDGAGALLPPIARHGYHQLELDGHRTTLAIAPPDCFTVPEAVPDRRAWGIAVQLYGLRRDGDGGIGDYEALRQFVRHAAAKGADAVAISPTHAQFSADPDRFSPYAPSSRIAFNVLHAAVEDFPGRAELEALNLVDWPTASRARLVALRQAFAAAEQDQAVWAEFSAFRSRSGEALESHARFEALHAVRFTQYGQWNWRDWPGALHDPQGPAVAAFAHAHAQEVTFHAFLQFLAERGLAAAQAAARSAGMGIGLISDLAVGTDGGGSHAWSRQDEMLIGLSVGAPPDLLSPHGQNWGLAAFSPIGLVQHGFSAFIEMLRAALRHAGGVRIDHVMGLARLWVVPEGAPASEGAYLRFPLDDMLRLVALESRRHRAVVLGEDLGTLPEGFQERLIARRLLGMRVLWFERQPEHFTAPAHWSRNAASMTSTHDLATVAGWWRGHDLEWRNRLGLLGDDKAVWFEYENRAADRALLWRAMQESGAAAGEAPPPDAPERVVDAAVAHVARSACELAILPIEDLVGSEEQPNLPGTLDQHPNWRRRLSAPADRVLDDEAVSARLSALIHPR